MTRSTLAALCLSVAASLALSACAGDPWVDSRREAGQIEPVGASTPDRVAICHAPGADAATLQAMAAPECAKTNRTPHYVGSTRFQCSLMTPHHSYFDCR